MLCCYLLAFKNALLSEMDNMHLSISSFDIFSLAYFSHRVRIACCLRCTSPSTCSLVLNSDAISRVAKAMLSSCSRSMQSRLFKKSYTVLMGTTQEKPRYSATSGITESYILLSYALYMFHSIPTINMYISLP
jgi:hypothetical protein